MKSAPILLLCAASACGGGIRIVQTTKTGGEIALSGSRESSMPKAREEMARVCGGVNAYEIVEEGEASTFDKPTQPVADPREWRVRFQCKAASGS
jgi:hypothetical protein